MQRLKQPDAKNKAIQCRTILGSAPPNKGNICINFNLQSLKQRKNSSNPTKKKNDITPHKTIEKRRKNAISHLLEYNNEGIRMQ